MRLAILGDPVAHSLSPLLHNAALRAAGLPGEYVARRVDASGLVVAFDDLRSGQLDGANVTMPHKMLAAGTCDGLAATAARSGAVNTLVRIGTAVVGHNTDVDGVRLAWGSAGLPTSDAVLVLGAGGAAAAALLALDGRKLFLAARRPDHAAALVEHVGVDAAVVEWASPMPGAVVVNATPLGMRGESLPNGVVESCSGLLDMVYGPGGTPAGRAAAAAGVPVADGTTMLLGQAVESFRLWTGRAAPVAAMTTALATAAHRAEAHA